MFVRALWRADSPNFRLHYDGDADGVVEGIRQLQPFLTGIQNGIVFRQVGNVFFAIRG